MTCYKIGGIYPATVNNNILISNYIKMYRKILISTAMILFFNSALYPQQLMPMRVIPGEWIRTWLLCGPVPLQEYKDPSMSLSHLDGFANDYLSKAGGEQDLKVKPGDNVKLGKGSVRWMLYTTPDSIIDLDKIVSSKDPVLAYAYTEIQADKPGIWFLALGSNDGGSLWINGLKIWDYSLPRGLSADDDIIPVMLNEGTNKILLKIEDRGNRWGFCIRFLAFSTDRLDDRVALLGVTTGTGWKSIDNIKVFNSCPAAPHKEYGY